MAVLMLPDFAQPVALDRVVADAAVAAEDLHGHVGHPAAGSVRRVRLGRANPDAAWRYGNDRAGAEFRRVFCQGFAGGRPLQHGRDIDPPDDPGVSHPAMHGQLAEVLVDRDQHRGTVTRVQEYLRIARVRGPVANLLNVVAGALQAGRGAGPDAGIPQDFHAPCSGAALRAGSMRSRATMHQA